jgi:P4 family phage/plasmid primase-like protien
MSMNDLIIFLKDRRVSTSAANKTKGTHTGLYFPFQGSLWRLEGEDLDTFWTLYTGIVRNTKPRLGITEIHEDIGPVLIDIDIKFLYRNSTKRVYSEADITFVVKVYTAIINSLVKTDEMKAYVFEKPAPRLIKKDQSDEVYVKDGIHIIFVDACVSFHLHKYIHELAIEQMEKSDSLSHIGPVKSIMDTCIVKNPWMLYGTTKQDEQSGYKLTMTVMNDTITTVTAEEEIGIDPRMFSIQGKVETELTELGKIPIVSHDQKASGVEYDVYDEHSKVVELLDLLSPGRCTNENTWVEVGWCLHNINKSYLGLWVEWSRKSDNFSEGVCEKKWKRFKNEGFKMGSLFLWASLDSPEQYKVFIQKYTSILLENSIGCGAHYDIAMILHVKYESYFRSSHPSKDNAWWYFENHRWQEMEGGYLLMTEMSKFLSNEFLELAKKYRNLEIKNAGNNQLKKECEEKKSNCLKLNYKIKDHTFKKNVLKECVPLFYDKTLAYKLDSNIHLIGFENGVFDTRTMEFRNGVPEDYLSKTTGNNYETYNMDDPVILEIMSFLNNVFTNVSLRDYVLTILATFLEGSTEHQTFQIWTGFGCHSKNTPVLMYDGTQKMIQDIVVDDVLMGDDNTERTVSRLWRGGSEMFKITMSEEGHSFNVNGRHKISLKVTEKSKPRITMRFDKFVLTYIEVVSKDEYEGYILNKLETEHASYFEVAHAYVNVIAKDTVLKIGDVVDVQVYNYLKYNMDVFNLRMFRPDCVDFAPSPSDANLDPWKLGIFLGTVDDSNLNLKHIPHEYKVSSSENRRKLMAGIIESAGIYNENHTYEVHLQNTTLMDDVIFVVRSLGLTAIALGSTCVITNGRNVKFEIEQVEDDDFYGVEVDKNHRYVMGNFVVTSNSNGKSTLIELFEKSFGDDYCAKFPVTLLTKDRASSNACTPELQEVINKRFANLQEPDDNDSLKTGAMKEYTGGDKLYSRGLFSRPTPFKPQFHLLMTCNKMPEIKGWDNGTWRRIRVVPFTSVFVDDEPTAENEFKKDKTLFKNFERWSEPFMFILIEYLKEYKKLGKIVEPDLVIKASKEYQMKSDMYASYINDHLMFTSDDTDRVKISDVYTSFKYWWKATNNTPAPKQTEFMEYMSANVKGCKINKQGITRMKLVHEENDD